MKRALVRCIENALCVIGRRRGVTGTRVLVYHLVRDADAFARHVAALLDFTAHVRPENLGDDGFALTFDDGFRGNCDTAFPVMEREGLRGFVFVVTDTLSAGAADNRRTARARFPRLGLSDTEAEFLRADELRDLARRGFVVGSHTRTHADLGDPNADLNAELVGSRRDLAESVGEPWALAYPYGRARNVPARAREAALAAGYTACFGAHRGSLLPDSDRSMLPRDYVEPSWSARRTRSILTGALDAWDGLGGR